MADESVLHGGPDALGVPEHDFSTNANAAGPCPHVLDMLREADPSTYPDPAYAALRLELAEHHGVAPERVLPMASASEAMFRIGAAARALGVAQVWMPEAHYADLGRAAAAWGLTRVKHAEQAALVWACEPSTPTGQKQPDLVEFASGLGPEQVLLWDAAYEPLRLSGASSLDAKARSRVWQLWSPNKALGLTGVRGAYLVAPEVHSATRQRWMTAIAALAPSWPIGVHGVAMLRGWCAPETRVWLEHSRAVLREWKANQLGVITAMGWTHQPSEANYVLVRPSWPGEQSPATIMAQWRETHGVKVRDATSFGWPGWVRLGVRSPVSTRSLQLAAQATVCVGGMAQCGITGPMCR